MKQENQKASQPAKAALASKPKHQRKRREGLWSLNMYCSSHIILVASYGRVEPNITPKLAYCVSG